MARLPEDGSATRSIARGSPIRDSPARHRPQRNAIHDISMIRSGFAAAHALAWPQMKFHCTVVALFIASGTAADAAKPEEPPKIEEVLIVTASRTEHLVHDVPSAVSVITA